MPWARLCKIALSLMAETYRDQVHYRILQAEWHTTREVTQHRHRHR